MKESYLKKTLFFSILGHLSVFGIFSFSFGTKMPLADYTAISFRGDFLGTHDFIYNNTGIKASFPKNLLTIHQAGVLPARSQEMTIGDSGYYLKPTADLSFSQQKLEPKKQSLPLEAPEFLARKESSVTLHPQLPYYFIFYFKDRQVVHIELEYKIVRQGRSSSIIVKRKTSSGNLEVDLLCKRYISHYLFIRQSRLKPDIWQKVEIDFSAK